MADPVGQQPGDSHLMHVSGDDDFAVASEGAGRNGSPGQTFPALPSEHVIEGRRCPEMLFTDTEGSTQLLQRLDDRYALVLTVDYERMMTIVRTQLGERAFATAWAEGRVMTPEQVLAQQGREIAHEPVIPVLQPPPPTVSRHDYPAGLTAREVQVLRMVAKGLTNNEIAEELRLSEKTIAHHLTHIFNKTSSENRAAAAFAIRHGLA